MGVCPDDFGCNDAEFVSVFDSQGNPVSSKDVRNLRDLYPFVREILTTTEFLLADHE